MSIQARVQPTREEDEPSQEVFGWLLSITVGDMTRLASRIRHRVLHASTSTSRLVARVAGPFNLVHIVELDHLKRVIRVPASTGSGDGMTKTAARALESQVTVMRLIAKETRIPVPTVYEFDTSSDNDIGAPYICMSFVSGDTVSRLWFDGPTSRAMEDRRLRILESTAKAMAQLSRLSFKKIGSPYEGTDGTIAIDP